MHISGRSRIFFLKLILLFKTHLDKIIVYQNKIVRHRFPSWNGGEKMNMQSVQRKWQTRTLTVTGLLGAVSIVLGMTPLGFIPMPTAAGHATIMHVPAILGGVLEGPIVGALTGLIFGFYSFMQAGNALFIDPLVAIVPRVFIGVVAWGVYRLTRSCALAAAFGTLTNTCGVLGIAVARGYLTGPVAWGVVLTHGIPEIIVAVAITGVISKILRRIRR